MKLLKNILFWVTTTFLVVAIALFAIPQLFGIEFRAVVTGSMTPEIPVGSLVVIVPTPSEDIQVGDDITFLSTGNKAVTHRVIEIHRESNEFITRGIANAENAIDKPNHYDNILGVVKVSVPVVGFVFSWIATPHGKIITATAIVAIYLISVLLGVWMRDKKKPMVESQEAPGVPLTGNPHLVELMNRFQKSEEMFETALVQHPSQQEKTHCEPVKEDRFLGWEEDRI